MSHGGENGIRRCTRIETRTANLVNAIATGGITLQPLLDELQHLEKEKTAVQERHREWKFTQHCDLTEPAVKTYLTHYREELLWTFALYRYCIPQF